MSTERPREWWIETVVPDGRVYDHKCSITDPVGFERIVHVIEHSAFLKKCKEVEIYLEDYKRVCKERDEWKFLYTDEESGFYKELEATRKERDRLRAALERIAEMAVRPKCVCGLPTGTGAIEMSARKALEGK